MIVHKSWIVNSLLSFAIALTCVIGDKKLRTTTGALKKAIFDNSTHSLVGFFSALVVLHQHFDKLYLALVCTLLSSLIDADHFITAKSLKLTDATSLQSRPFLHNSVIPVVLIALLIYCHVTSRSQNLILFLIIAVTAFVTHHVRDANRRGLWFPPFGSTPALSDTVYIVLTLITPYVLKYFVPDIVKYSRVPSTIIDV